MYINDLPSYIHDAWVHLYADDMAISVSVTSLKDLEDQLNNKMAKAHLWMTKNHLTLNLSKCKCMVLGITHTLQDVNSNNIRVKVNEVPVETSRGVQIPRCSFRPEANFLKLCRTCNKEVQ